MKRSRAVQLAAILSATLALASVAVVSSSSHEQDESPGPGQGGTAGPRRGDAVAMPPGLVGLEIALGLSDARRTEWAGEVTVSQGRVLGIDVVRAAVDATVEGGKF